MSTWNAQQEASSVRRWTFWAQQGFMTTPTARTTYKSVTAVLSLLTAIPTSRVLSDSILTTKTRTLRTELMWLSVHSWQAGNLPVTLGNLQNRSVASHRPLSPPGFSLWNVTSGVSELWGESVCQFSLSLSLFLRESYSIVSPAWPGICCADLGG